MTREFSFKIDWILVFLLLPFFYLSNHDLRNVQLSAFQVLAFVLLGVMHVNRWLGSFLLWITVQSFFFPKTELQSFYLQNFFLGAFVYHFIVKYSNVRELKKYFWVLVSILLVNIFWCVLQIFQIDPLFSITDFDHQKVFTEYPGFFALPAFLGNYAAVVTPLIFLLSPWLIPFSLAALWFSKSTFSILAAAAGSCLFLWFKKRIIFWGFLLLGVAVISIYALKFDLPTGQFMRRIRVWSVVFGLSLRKQFFGYGLSNYRNFIFGESTPSHNLMVARASNSPAVLDFMKKEARNSGNRGALNFLESVSPDRINIFQIRENLQKNNMDFHTWTNLHNEFLESFFETGLIGIVLIGGFINDLFKRFFKYGTRDPASVALASSFIAILIVSFGHFPFHLARLAAPFLSMIAFFDLCLIELQKKKLAGGM